VRVSGTAATPPTSLTCLANDIEQGLRGFLRRARLLRHRQTANGASIGRRHHEARDVGDLAGKQPLENVTTALSPESSAASPGGRPPWAPSRDRYITFDDYFVVVELVASNVKRKTASCGYIAIDHSAARPCTGTQVAKQGNRCSANRYVIRENIFHGKAGEARAGNVLPLIEAGKVAVVTTRYTQSTVGEDSFIVSEMTKNLLDAPPVRPIREIAAQIAKRPEERDCRSLLAEKNLARVVSNDQLDIRLSVVRILAGDGATGRCWMAMHSVQLILSAT
jgi:hypothetical protein